MYARVNIIFGSKEKVDAGIEHIEGTARALVEATRGNQGLATLVDRDAGVIVAMSYWDEPLHSSEAALTRAREDSAAAAGGDLVVERFELVDRTRVSVPQPGTAVRLTRVQLDPAGIPAGLAFIQDEVLARVSKAESLRSAEVLVDRDSGNGLVVTAWADADSARSADGIVEQLRDVAVERVGAKFPQTESYSLVRTSVRSD